VYRLAQSPAGALPRFEQCERNRVLHHRHHERHTQTHDCHEAADVEKRKSAKLSKVHVRIVAQSNRADGQENP
jgi:hypothetical protein